MKYLAFGIERSITAAALAVAVAALPAASLAATFPFAHARNVPGLSRIAAQPPVPVQLAFLLTDGSVLGQSVQNSTWYEYVPDAVGDYADGTWSQVASLPSGYAPSAFSSAVLADGRLAITGGEYNNGGPYQLQLTNLGAVYDPTANRWTPLGHPDGWNYIGDSPNSVLPGGQFFVGQKLTERAAHLDPKTLRWTSVGTAGKADFNAEEGFTLLPDGSILTLDVKAAPNSERYFASSQTWKSAGSTIVDLHSPTPINGCIRYGPAPKDCYYPPGEIGPAMLRPDGTVFATGSGSGPSGNGAGHTAVYHTVGAKAGTWTVGPDFPNGDNAGDSFAALLPSGNVLVFGNSGTLYEFDGSALKPVAGASGSPLLLPTGQVLIFGNGISLYTPSGVPQAAWAPHVAAAPARVVRGKTYRISGTQFNGLSQALAFGDEYQNATNYPLVRLTNLATKHVFYARTHDHSSMGVATGSTPVSTFFDVPKTMDAGATTLEVVANGIASKAISISVR